MKNILILLLLTISIYAQAQSPNWNEWFRQKKTQRKYLRQQIIALKVYLEYLKQGYQIVDKGLSTISTIKNGKLQLDKNYLESLKQINPIIKNSPKVNEVLIIQQRISSAFRKLLHFCQTNENFQASEISYIESVYTNILKECELGVDELLIVCTAGTTEMKDDERLLRLDKIHEEMLDKYGFTKAFTSSTYLVAAQRAKLKHNSLSIEKLYTPLPGY